MRLAFIKTLLNLAQDDPRIVLLTADLGYGALESFRDRLPKQFINVGVAEQNMVGIATGLAESGFLPFVYSIATFATLRPFEFIRNGPIAHKLPVRIVGVGGGMEYSHNGLTHYGIEDVGVMRIQPGITVLAPADFQQTETILRSSWNLAGPIYYRLGKDDRTVVPGLTGAFVFREPQVVRNGQDCLLISMGGISSEVSSAAKLLEDRGLSCTHAVLATLNPSPNESLVSLIAKFKYVFTVEAHYLVGGLGSLVSEIIAEQGLNCRLNRIGIAKTPDGITGGQNFLNDRYALSAQAIVEKVTGCVRVQEAAC